NLRFNVVLVGADLSASFKAAGEQFASKLAPTMATCIPILWERIYSRMCRQFAPTDIQPLTHTAPTLQPCGAAKPPPRALYRLTWLSSCAEVFCRKVSRAENSVCCALS